MKILGIILNIFLIGALLIFVSTLHADERKLLVVGEAFAPFEFVQDDKVVGIDIDIASHIFKKMNIPVEFRLYPWKRAWHMVEKGKADAVLTTSRKDKRMPYVWYPEENMWVGEYVFFVRIDKMQKNFNGYQTAVKNKMRVGIISENSYHPSFWKAFPYKDGSTTFQGGGQHVLNPQLKQAPNLEVNLRILAKGHIDLYPADKVTGAYTAKLLGLGDQLTYYDIPLYSKPYPMPFVQNSTYPNIKQIADQFEQELKALKAGGDYQRFFENWLK